MKTLLMQVALLAGLSRFAGRGPTRPRAEWGAYLGSFGDDFFGDD